MCWTTYKVAALRWTTYYEVILDEIELRVQGTVDT